MNQKERLLFGFMERVHGKGNVVVRSTQRRNPPMPEIGYEFYRVYAGKTFLREPIARFLGFDICPGYIIVAKKPDERFLKKESEKK